MCYCVLCCRLLFKLIQLSNRVGEQRQLCGLLAGRFADLAFSKRTAWYKRSESRLVS